MSQIKFNSKLKNGDKVEVMGGWDSPLQEYFVTIFLDDGEVHASTMDNGGRSKADVQELLDDNGINPPPGFWQLMDLREGNTVHRFVNDKWIYNKV